jgi:hypothetical protein
MDMTDRELNSPSESRPEISANPSRRRVIAAMGTMAAASWFPLGIKAQGTTTETDILIIGGGMAGSATAFHLASHGRDVTLLERGEIASEASGQNMHAGPLVLPDNGQPGNFQGTANRHGL